MRNPKYYIAIDEFERRIIIGSSNNLRNKLIAYSTYTDATDVILIRIAHAPIKKFKVKYNVTQMEKFNVPGAYVDTASV